MATAKVEGRSALYWKAPTTQFRPESLEERMAQVATKMPELQLPTTSRSFPDHSTSGPSLYVAPGSHDVMKIWSDKPSISLPTSTRDPAPSGEQIAQALAEWRSMSAPTDADRPVEIYKARPKPSDAPASLSSRMAQMSSYVPTLQQNPTSRSFPDHSLAPVSYVAAGSHDVVQLWDDQAPITDSMSTRDPAPSAEDIAKALAEWRALSSATEAGPVV